MNGYSETKEKLQNVCFLVFQKMSGDMRIMCATRDVDFMELLIPGITFGLDKHDARSNEKNGNIAVIDIEKKETRSFNVKRLLCIEVLGQASTPEELDKLMKVYQDYKKAYAEPLGIDTPNDEEHSRARTGVHTGVCTGGIHMTDNLYIKKLINSGQLEV